MRSGLTLAAVALVIAGLYCIGIGHTLADTDEVIYAEFIRAMHQSGDYFTLRWEGAAVLQRPSLPVAMYAVVSAVVPGELGLRLLPALLSAGAASACGFTVLRRSKCLEAGCAAALLCAGVVTYAIYGRIVLSDPPFVLAVVGAIAATMAAHHDPKWLPWAAASLGAAFATKSLAAAIPAVALTPWLVAIVLRHRGTGRLRIGWSIAAFVALAAPFYVVGVARSGGQFIDVHFGYNLAHRAGGIEGIGLGGPLSYIRHMWTVDGPIWFAIDLGAPLACVALGARRRERDLLIPASVALGCLVLLSLIGTRLSHYLMPVYAASAICAGMLAARAVEWLRGKQRLAGWAVPALAAALFFTGISAPAHDPWLAPADDARALAEVASENLEPGEPIYSLDWYAPTLGYYSHHPWRLLTASRRMIEIVGSIDIFESSGTVIGYPPFPDKARLIIAGQQSRLSAARGLRVVRVIEQREGFALVEAIPVTR